MFQKHIREFVPFPGSPSANFSTFTNIRSRCLTFVRSVKKFLSVSARKPCFGFIGTYFSRQLSLLAFAFLSYSSLYYYINSPSSFVSFMEYFSFCRTNFFSQCQVAIATLLFLNYSMFVLTKWHSKVWSYRWRWKHKSIVSTLHLKIRLSCFWFFSHQKRKMNKEEVRNRKIEKTERERALHKKWSFPLRISLVNVTKSADSWGGETGRDGYLRPMSDKAGKERSYDIITNNVRTANDLITVWYRGWLGQHGHCYNTKTLQSFLNIRLCLSNSRSNLQFSLKASKTWPSVSKQILARVFWSSDTQAWTHENFLEI